MFNLLPKTEKEAIRREYRFRLAIVILGLSFGSLIIASVLLLPSFLLSSEKEKAAGQRYETLSASVKHNSSDNLDAVLRDAKQHLALLGHESPKILLHTLILRIASLKSDRVSLSNFSFVGMDDGKKTVTVSGVARDRASLLAFVRAIERAGLFEKVDVPISNFAKDTDINFSITATGAF